MALAEKYPLRNSTTTKINTTKDVLSSIAPSGAIFYAIRQMVFDGNCLEIPTYENSPYANAYFGSSIIYMNNLEPLFATPVNEKKWAYLNELLNSNISVISHSQRFCVLLNTPGVHGFGPIVVKSNKLCEYDADGNILDVDKSDTLDLSGMLVVTHRTVDSAIRRIIVAKNANNVFTNWTELFRAVCLDNDKGISFSELAVMVF